MQPGTNRRHNGGHLIRAPTTAGVENGQEGGSEHGRHRPRMFLTAQESPPQHDKRKPFTIGQRRGRGSGDTVGDTDLQHVLTATRAADEHRQVSRRQRDRPGAGEQQPGPRQDLTGGPDPPPATVLVQHAVVPADPPVVLTQRHGHLGAVAAEAHRLRVGGRHQDSPASPSTPSVPGGDASPSARLGCPWFR
ncbi:hypothetical protein [Amycolatopsis panacis]|uniref:hypothetical protein n=1 Tax=Amycolatopsis panacis TaxID=2340917 RepID=UPI0013148E42|nr:hypothetical protein [Amycolatopsis panacis]